MQHTAPVPKKRTEKQLSLHFSWLIFQLQRNTHFSLQHSEKQTFGKGKSNFLATFLFCFSSFDCKSTQNQVLSKNKSIEHQGEHQPKPMESCWGVNPPLQQGEHLLTASPAFSYCCSGTNFEVLWLSFGEWEQILQGSEGPSRQSETRWDQVKMCCQNCYTASCADFTFVALVILHLLSPHSTWQIQILKVSSKHPTGGSKC